MTMTSVQSEAVIQSSQESEMELYEAPAIESVVTLEELEREVHYAGLVISGGNFA